MSSYKIGDTMPLEGTGRIEGQSLSAPVWYAIKVAPGREAHTRDYLKSKGVHATYPSRESCWRIRGKQICRKYPVVTQIVYAKFKRQPLWHLLKARKLITGVFSYGPEPIQLDGEIVKQIMGLPTEQERIQTARDALMEIRIGDAANIEDGPLAGMTVDVRSCLDGRIFWETVTGLKGEAAAASLKRLVPDEEMRIFESNLIAVKPSCDTDEQASALGDELSA